MAPVSIEKLRKRKQNSEVYSIEEKVKDVLISRKYSNYLVDIVQALTHKNIQVVMAAENAIQKVFLNLLQNEEMVLFSDITEDNETKYKIWLQEVYTDAKNSLLHLLFNNNSHIQALSLVILMKLVAYEGKFPLKPAKENRIYFPFDLLKQIVSRLLSNSENMNFVINQFQEFLDYDDVRFYTLKSLVPLIKQQRAKEEVGIFLENTFALLSQIHPPEKPTDDDHRLSNLYVNSDDGKLYRIQNFKSTQKLFSTAWLEFLKYEVSHKLQKKILIILHDKVLPYISEPILLTDFLTEAYNIGGVVSLLALNSLYFLIQNCNLEYPDFYKKLYMLLQPDILYTKYRSRFLFLADLFLTSTHLPSYLVAAFCKRLARLAITAPPDCLLVIIPFIGNLLIRHPNLKILIHKPDVKDLSDDPYLMDEADPANCRALESSLWEIKTLQLHWHPDVHVKAKFIENPLPQMEWEISELLGSSISNLMDKVARKKFKQVHLSFYRPSKLFSTEEDKMNMLWTLH